jgi:hypothetical protein
VPIEIVLLHVERREIPMAVEACLADRHDARLAGYCYDSIPIAGIGLRNVIRLHADCRVDALEFTGQSHAHGARRRRDADCDDVLNTCFARTRDNVSSIDVEFSLIQMRMRVK